jgi:sulfoxide reductase heme-binding subunit YedZ
MDELILRLKKHYLPLIILISIAGSVFYFKWPHKDSITFITDTTGYIAIVLIVISLVIGTIKMLLNRETLISKDFRRDLGIIAGILALIHSLTGLFVHLRGKNWQYFLNKTEHGYSIRLDTFGLANYFGVVSASIIILLLLTSNNYSIRNLGSDKWKNIQRLSYLMFILAIVHSVYYRIVMNNITLIYTLYLPLFIIVLIFQLIGIDMKMRERKKAFVRKG